MCNFVVVSHVPTFAIVVIVHGPLLDINMSAWKEWSRGRSTIYIQNTLGDNLETECG